MSDRWMRTDNRRNHHSWQENARRELREMEKRSGNRINVTADDQQKRIAEIEATTWDEQADVIRKENAPRPARVGGGAAMPADIEKRLAALAKLAEIAKKFINRPGPADNE